MHAVHPVQRPVSTTSSYRSRHCVVSALGILGAGYSGCSDQMLRFRYWGSDAERVAAGASVDRLGVVDLEPAPQEGRIEVQRGARDDGHAFRVDHDANVVGGA